MPRPSFAKLHGLSSPFRRDGVNDFASASGRELLKSKLSNILGVLCTGRNTIGELAWRPEFGSLLELVRHSNDNETSAAMARQWAQDAFAQWAPSVRVLGVDVVNATLPSGDDALDVVVRYDPGDGVPDSVTSQIPRT